MTVTDQDFAEQVLHASLPVIIAFTVSWCPHCRALAPVFERLGQTYAGKLRFACMDTDENLQTPVQVGIQGVPTLVLFANGQPVGGLVGPHPARLQLGIDRLLAQIGVASRQMNGRLVRKTLSFSKEHRLLKAASARCAMLSTTLLVPSRHYVLNWKSPQNVRVGNNERLLWLLNSQTIFGV